MTRIVLALLLALAAAPALAQAPAPERLVDAGKVFVMLDKFYATPPADRSKLEPSYVVTQDKKPVPNLRLTLVADGKRIPLPLGPNGRIERLPSATELAHARIEVAGAKGPLQIQIALFSSIRPAEEINAAECALAISQANSSIKRAAGLMAMLAPQVKATTFPGSGSGVAVMADGKTTPLPLLNGTPTYDPAVIKGARTLRLAKAPSAVGFE
jgi:hypothetical protein